MVAISLVLAARSYYKIQASSTLHTEFIFGRIVEPVMLTNAKLIQKLYETEINQHLEDSALIANPLINTGAPSK